MLIHERTSRQVSSAITQKTQSILITGEAGAGKSFIADYVIAQILQIDQAAVEKHPYILRISAVDGKSVKIDQIREIKQFLKLSVPGASGIVRFVIIESAETMSIEAQNAALKVIEEPPKDTMLLLLAPREQGLLSTIQSRCQTVVVLPVDKDTALDFAKSVKVTDAEAQKQYALSGGLAGLYIALLNNTADHPLVKAIDSAKKLLGSTQFERLVLVDSYSKDKEELARLLFALDRIAEAGLRQAAAKGGIITRWQTILTSVEDAEKKLAANVSAKLVLTNLMLVL